MLTLPSPRLFRRATVRRYANHIEFAYTVPQIFHRPLALRSVLRTLPWNLPFSDSHAAQLTEASANHTVFRLLHGTSYGRIRTLDHQTIPSDTAYGNFRTNDYERPPQRPISRKHPHNQPPKHGSTPMMLVPLPPILICVQRVKNAAQLSFVTQGMPSKGRLAIFGDKPYSTATVRRIGTA
ncbi:hypothetical protein CNCMI4602_0026 [Bifidobacterium animalis subsp. animalis]|nr:hypothetical protein CNCMI4602_0026 [Bifidobacterium animalis subsp. animalis]